MRHILFTVPLLLVPVISKAASVTIQEACQAALANTETTAINQARANQADARLRQAKSKNLPNLQIAATLQKPERASAFEPIIEGTQTVVRLTASQSIYEGGRDQAAVSSAALDKEGDTFSARLANIEAYTAVSGVFYSILSADRDIENISKTIDLAKARIKEIKSRIQIGKARHIDLLAANAQLSVLNAQRMEVAGDLATVRSQFALVTGLSKDSSPVEDSKDYLKPQDVEKYLSQIDKRPDIELLRNQVKAATLKVAGARAGHRPTVSLAGNYYLARDKQTDKDKNWDVALTMGLPLYSGGLVQAQVREATEAGFELEARLQEQRRKAEIEIRTIYLDLVSEIGQLEALTQALATTQENFREQEKNYRFSQATNLDVLQALNLYQDTKRSLDRLRYQAMASWIKLKLATAGTP